MTLFLLFSPVSAVSTWEILASAIVVLSAIVAAVRWVRPRLKRVKNDVVGARDSLLGREEVRDSITGEVKIPALPGIGVRMDSQERQMAVITEAVAKIAESHIRLEQHDTAISDLSGRVSKLEQAAVERIVNRQESAAAFRAIEAAHKSTPEDAS